MSNCIIGDIGIDEEEFAFYKFVWIYIKFESISNPSEELKEAAIETMLENALKVLNQTTEEKSADISFIIEGNINGVNSWLKLKIAEGMTNINKKVEAS